MRPPRTDEPTEDFFMSVGESLQVALDISEDDEPEKIIWVAATVCKIDASAESFSVLVTEFADLPAEDPEQEDAYEEGPYDRADEGDTWRRVPTASYILEGRDGNPLPGWQAVAAAAAEKANEMEAQAADAAHAAEAVEPTSAAWTASEWHKVGGRRPSLAVEEAASVKKAEEDEARGRAASIEEQRRIFAQIERERAEAAELAATNTAEEQRRILAQIERERAEAVEAAVIKAAEEAAAKVKAAEEAAAAKAAKEEAAADLAAEARRSRAKGEDRSSECAVCMDKPRTHAFLPCLHRCVCADCALKIMGAATTVAGARQCPYCRVPASAAQEVYM